MGLPPGAPEAPPPLLSPPAPASHAFVFHGNTQEYFRIWIVNTLLTLITLGLYLAWAKVRKRRYLRGNTELMGHRFDYRADPARILVGNVLVGIMFIAYMVVGEVYPAVRFGALGVGAVLLPWVIVRSLAFNAHNTVYRGMRFYSHRTYGSAALLYLGQGLLVLLSLGFYYPVWIRNRRKFTIESHRLGDAFFRFDSPIGPIYGAYIVGGVMVVGAASVGTMIIVALTALNEARPPGTAALIPFMVLYLFAAYCAKHYIYAQLFNQVWNNTRLDGHRFVATLSTGTWMRLQLGNLGAMLISGGLLYPWAAIRSARYALSCLAFVPERPIEKISRLGRSGGSAVGETAAEFVGLDIGL